MGERSVVGVVMALALLAALAVLLQVHLGPPPRIFVDEGSLFNVRTLPAYSPGVNTGPTRDSGAATTACAPAGDARNDSREFYDLVVFVPSVVGWTRRRHLLRQQWQRSVARLPAGTRVWFRFVFGGKFLTAAERATVEQEHALHNDTLVLPDVHDFDAEPMTLTSATSLKVLRTIAHVVASCRFRHLARVGDDAYFNVNEFLRVRDSFPAERLLLGRFMFHKQFGDNRISRFHRMRTSPPYPLGPGYIFTYDVAHFLGTASLPLVVTEPEDAMVGLWLAGVHLNKVDDARLHNINRPPEPWSLAPCRPTDIITHYMEDADWQNIDDYGVLRC